MRTNAADLHTSGSRQALGLVAEVRYWNVFEAIYLYYLHTSGSREAQGHALLSILTLYIIQCVFNVINSFKAFI